MARHQSVIVFNAKMYKHFAIVTVALTFAIAMFADGEKRAAVVETAADIQEYAEKKDTGPTLVIRNSDVGAGGPDLGSFYSDVGQNIYGTGFASSTVHASRRLSKLAKSVTDAQLAKLGMTKDQFLALSDQEKEKILVQLNNGQAFASESTVKSSTAASLRRSGRSGQSADY